MTLRKIYNPNKKRIEWALVSKSNPQKILQYFGNVKPSKERVLHSERRVQYFKNFGSIPKTRVFRYYKRGKKGGKGQRYWVNDYQEIVRKARKKGYRLPRYGPGRGPLQITELDIPESFKIDGFTMDITEGMKKWSGKEAKKFKGKFLVGIDDDAPKVNKRKALAHELGHVHLYSKGTKPHTENKAEVIGADILSMPVDKFKEGIVFDKSFSKRGINLCKKRR